MGRMIRGRLSRGPDPFAEEFVASVVDDEKLVPFDVQGSIAHAKALRRAGLLTAQEEGALVKALRRIRREHDAGKWRLRVEDEDVHMNVERRLGKLAGKAAAKIHAGRSRNDQVALDLRLWCREEIDGLIREVRALRLALVRKAERHSEVILPGYTHLQRAQPILLAHLLLSFQEQLARDEERLSEVRCRVNISPLGAAALAGTSLPIDPRLAARELGFDGVSANSLDAVGDRDFAVEMVFVCALLQTHLSQVAESLILWSSAEFDFIQLPDELCTSSSIMPQKKNADMIELVRAKTGRVAGDLMNLLLVLKALPTGYNRDLQETKPPLFDAVATARGSLGAMTLAVKGMKIRKASMEEAARGGGLLATDLAEYLVEKGIPFREAHRIVARLARRCAARGHRLEEVSLPELKKLSSAFQADILKRLSPGESIRRKGSPGSTGTAAVRRRLRRLSRSL